MRVNGRGLGDLLWYRIPLESHLGVLKGGMSKWRDGHHEVREE